MTTDAGERTYEIRQVAELTGLDTSRLRAWERRYKVVQPTRLANGYRVYSAGQVALLRAFARLIARGEKIGNLVGRPMEEVILEAEQIETPESAPPELLRAVLALDRARLTELVAEEIERRGLAGFAESVVVPLAHAVGDMWALGFLPVAAEHLASEVIVQALKHGIGDTRRPGPLVLASTMPGERHEWGFLSTLVALRSPEDPEPLIAVGRAAGEIARERAGEHGFGFDPVMFIPAFGQTFAQLPPEVKNAHSHRGHAARQMIALIRERWLP